MASQEWQVKMTGQKLNVNNDISRVTCKDYHELSSMSRVIHNFDKSIFIIVGRTILFHINTYEYWDHNLQ